MLGSSLLASRCRSAVSPKVASSGTEISKHFLSLVADDFTFSSPRDDLNDKAVLSFEVKGRRRGTKSLSSAESAAARYVC